MAASIFKFFDIYKNCAKLASWEYFDGRHIRAVKRPDGLYDIERRSIFTPGPWRVVDHAVELRPSSAKVRAIFDRLEEAADDADRQRLVVVDMITCRGQVASVWDAAAADADDWANGDMLAKEGAAAKLRWAAKDLRDYPADDTEDFRDRFYRAAGGYTSVNQLCRWVAKLREALDILDHIDAE